MQFFTKFQVFGNNFKLIQKEKKIIFWRICDPSSSLHYTIMVLYPLDTAMEDYQECKVKENQALKKSLCHENILK